MNQDLQTEVEAAVNQLLSNREHFTTVDVSRPIIEKDPAVRHRDVRKIINDLWARGDIEAAGFAVSNVTVYPEKGGPQNVRLFHPDDPNYDSGTYTATHQVIQRDGSASKTRGFTMDAGGDDGSQGQDNVTVITTTSTGAKVTKQCQIQPKQGGLNIPKLLVTSLGLKAGDNYTSRNDGTTIVIEKSHQDGSKVDKEGRIRLYGKVVDAMNKTSGIPCSAMLVEPAGAEKYIQVS